MTLDHITGACLSGREKKFVRPVASAGGASALDASGNMVVLAAHKMADAAATLFNLQRNGVFLMVCE